MARSVSGNDTGHQPSSCRRAFSPAWDTDLTALHRFQDFPGHRVSRRGPSALARITQSTHPLAGSRAQPCGRPQLRLVLISNSRHSLPGRRACTPRGWSRTPHLVRLAPEGWKRAHPPQPALRIGLPDQQQFDCPVSAKQSCAAWARLIKKVYEADPLTCSRCGEPMRVLAVITEPTQILKILRHLIKIAKPPPGLDPASLN